MWSMRGGVVLHQLIPRDVAKELHWTGFQEAGLRVLPEGNNGLTKRSRGLREAARPVLRTYILGKGANRKEVVNMGRSPL